MNNYFYLLHFSFSYLGLSISLLDLICTYPIFLKSLLIFHNVTSLARHRIYKCVKHRIVETGSDLENLNIAWIASPTASHGILTQVSNGEANYKIFFAQIIFLYDSDYNQHWT